MAREIKFRVWDGERMIVPGEGEHVIFWNDPKHVAWALYSQHGIKINDSQYDAAPIMQFTGLKDKNGKEVYEGDIVRHYGGHHRIPDTEYVVEWREKFTGFILSNKRMTEQQLNWRDGAWLWRVSKHLEIIGNIHENPELLKR